MDFAMIFIQYCGLHNVSEVGKLANGFPFNTTIQISWPVHADWMYQVTHPLIPHSNNPDSKVHQANMGPFWGRQDPRGPHVGPMNLAIWEIAVCACSSLKCSFFSEL